MKKRALISREERTAVEERFRAVLEEHGEISFAYVHGSFAEGREFADVDVALYLSALPPDPLMYEIDRESELALAGFGYVFDVRILNEAPLSFRYNAIKSGHLLFERNKDERSDFVERTLDLYFDFAPYRRMYLRETLGIGLQP